jgi:hypothetical protein
MLNWLGWLGYPKQTFADGSRIRPINRDEYEYVEPDGYATTIYAPGTGVGPVDRILVEESFARWHPPHDVEPISDGKRREIIQKFERYFSDRHISYRIE